MKDFKCIHVCAKDFQIFTEEAKGKDLKFCVMFNRMCKKMFPRRYEK